MRQSPREWGWPLEVFFPGTPSKIGELLKTNSCSVQQAVSCFTVTRCETAKSVKSLGLKDNTTNQIRMKIYSVHIQTAWVETKTVKK